MSTLPSVGQTVTFHYWRKGELHAAPATVVSIHDADDGPQALEVEVAFPEGVAEAEGFVTRQDHTRQRTITEDSIHASGTWTLPLPG